MWEGGKCNTVWLPPYLSGPAIAGEHREVVCLRPIAGLFHLILDELHRLSVRADMPFGIAAAVKGHRPVHAAGQVTDDRADARHPAVL